MRTFRPWKFHLLIGLLLSVAPLPLAIPALLSTAFGEPLLTTMLRSTGMHLIDLPGQIHVASRDEVLTLLSYYAVPYVFGYSMCLYWRNAVIRTDGCGIRQNDRFGRARFAVGWSEITQVSTHRRILGGPYYNVHADQHRMSFADSVSDVTALISIIRSSAPNIDFSPWNLHR